MKIKPKFSQKYINLKKRLQKLPKLFETTADSITKKDAEGFIKEYKDGIKNDNFGLKRLKKVTQIQKIKKGYSKPNMPLYGAGEAQKNSFINALRIKKIKNGYRVFISNAKHHEANLPLNILFDIHEKGCLIKVNSKKIIRIPPRPTRTKAFKRWIMKRIKNEDIKKSQRIISKYISTGNWEVFIKD